MIAPAENVVAEAWPVKLGAAGVLDGGVGEGRAPVGYPGVSLGVGLGVG